MSNYTRNGRQVELYRYSDNNDRCTAGQVVSPAPMAEVITHEVTRKKPSARSRQTVQILSIQKEAA